MFTTIIIGTSSAMGGESVKRGADALSSVSFSRSSPRTRTKISSPSRVLMIVAGPAFCGPVMASSVPQWLPGSALAGTSRAKLSEGFSPAAIVTSGDEGLTQCTVGKENFRHRSGYGEA